MFLGTLGFSWGCLYAYDRLGGGAAGAVGTAVVLAPFAVLLATLPVAASRRWARRRKVPILLGVLLPYGLFSCALPELARRERFDPAAWKSEAAKAAEYPASSHRLRQVDHLIDSGLLQGKSRAEVLALLGPDDRVERVRSLRVPFPDWDAAYWLGPMWIPVDDWWLVIRFDAGGRVSERPIQGD